MTLKSFKKVIATGVVAPAAVFAENECAFKDLYEEVRVEVNSSIFRNAPKEIKDQALVINERLSEIRDTVKKVGNQSDAEEMIAGLKLYEEFELNELKKLEKKYLASLPKGVDSRVSLALDVESVEDEVVADEVADTTEDEVVADEVADATEDEVVADEVADATEDEVVGQANPDESDSDVDVQIEPVVDDETGDDNTTKDVVKLVGKPIHLDSSIDVKLSLSDSQVAENEAVCQTIVKKYGEVFEYSQCVSMIKDVAEAIDFEGVSYELKSARVLDVMDRVLQNTDTPYVIDAFADPIIMKIMPAIIDVTIGNLASDLDSIVTLSEPGRAPSHEEYVVFFDALCNVYADGFQFRDIVTTLAYASIFLDSYEHLSLEEKKDCAEELFCYILDKTDTPIVPDFIADPALKLIARPILDLLVK